jgi:TolA-binding protein
MKTIASALIALSLMAGIAAPASADGYTSPNATGSNNSVNLP